VVNSRKNEARPALTKPRADKKIHRVADAIKKYQKQKRCEPVHVFVGNVGIPRIYPLLEANPNASLIKQLAKT
jgi:hypothetical protein